MSDAKSRAKELKERWNSDSRWKDVLRPYEAEDVVKLMGSVQIEHTLARRGSEKLWGLLNTEDFVPCLGALTGGQAVQQVVLLELSMGQTSASFTPPLTKEE